MESDQRILTSNRACVLQTIHKKEISCETHMHTVTIAEAIKNQYYKELAAAAACIVNLSLVLTGGDDPR